MAMIDRAFFKGGRLRPIFRLFYAASGILVVGAAVEFVAVAMPAPFAWMPGGLTYLFWFRLLLLPALLALFALMSRLLEQRPLGSVGLAFHPRWKNELGTGLIAGTAMMLAVAGAEGLLGVARFSLAPGPAAKTVLAGVFYFVVLMVAAADEELVFRGYPFQRLIDTVGPLFAVIVSAVVFGFAHFWNPFHTWISTLNTAAVGVLLAICYLRTRALWLPIGFHFAWNFVQGYVLGLPVSGVVFPHGILQAKISGPLWISGGAYGPESSILSLGVIAAGTVYFFVSRRIFTTDEMQRLALGQRNGKATGSSFLSLDGVPAGKRHKRGI